MNFTLLKCALFLFALPLFFITACVTSSPTLEASALNGTYILQAKHSGLVLDVPGSSTLDRMQLNQYVRNDTKAQQFKLEKVGSYYKMINVGNNKAVEVEASQISQDGGKVQQVPFFGGDHQLWTLQAVNGHYKIINKASGKVLDVSGFSKDNGALVHQWTSNDADNQRWKLIPVSATPPVSDFNGTTLHLNPFAANAKDSNNGSEASPLKTMQAAFEKMIPIKQAGTSVRILFYPGVYRDFVIGGDARPHWRIPNNSARLEFVAKEKGKTIITGSDVWTGWVSEGNGVWSKAWSYDWGASGTGNTYYGGGPPVSELAARRELVFVGGQRLAQVLDKSELRESSFQVDEAGNKLTLKLRAGVDPNTTTTEVAVREQLFYIWNHDNIAIRGLVFQHSANRFPEGAVAFQEGQGRGCTNITVVDTLIRNNGQLGLDNYCNNITLQRNQVNDNGFGGIMGTGDSWLFEDNQTNRNAWRSWAGGYRGWATAGVKVLDVDRFTMRRHEAIDNFADGVWLDTNISNVLIENSRVIRNRENGFFLEASQGPMTLRNNLVCGSGLSEVLLSAVRQTRLENNRILSNAPVNPTPDLKGLSVAIFYSELRRKDATYGQFPMRDITFQNNQIVATGQRNLTGGWIYYRPSDPADDEKQADYKALVSTLRSSGNTWYSPLPQPFGWVDTAKGYGENYDFATWKTLTKQDGNSSFSNPSLVCN
jgi:Ricin-type beta-trefoil lectin domain-like/Right handed beta helix region